MKLYAKIKPRYFERLRRGEKTIEYRQLETIVFTNTVTGEKIEFEVRGISGPIDQERIRREYPDVDWDWERCIYGIILGRRL